MPTDCPNCQSKLDGWRDYARHILDKHPKDEIRVIWARYVLGPDKKEIILRGKLADMIPPKRLRPEGF